MAIQMAFAKFLFARIRWWDYWTPQKELLEKPGN